MGDNAYRVFVRKRKEKKSAEELDIEEIVILTFIL